LLTPKTNDCGGGFSDGGLTIFGDALVVLWGFPSVWEINIVEDGEMNLFKGCISWDH
jgi:hypothetical protein